MEDGMKKGRQTTIPGCLKRTMPEHGLKNNFDFEGTPLFKAAVKAEIDKKQGNLFGGKK
jgi:hypothetical protein